MAQEQMMRITETAKPSAFDTYFETIQSRKKLGPALQESLTDAFAKIPVSSFPGVPGGKGKKINFTNAFEFITLYDQLMRLK